MEINKYRLKLMVSDKFYCVNQRLNCDTTEDDWRNSALCKGLKLNKNVSIYRDFFSVVYLMLVSLIHGQHPCWGERTVCRAEQALKYLQLGWRLKRRKPPVPTFLRSFRRGSVRDFQNLFNTGTLSGSGFISPAL